MTSVLETIALILKSQRATSPPRFTETQDQKRSLEGNMKLTRGPAAEGVFAVQTAVEVGDRISMAPTTPPAIPKNTTASEFPGAQIETTPPNKEEEDEDEEEDEAEDKN